MALKRLKNLLYNYATKQRNKVEEYKRKVKDVRWRMAEKMSDNRWIWNENRVASDLDSPITMTSLIASASRSAAPFGLS